MKGHEHSITFRTIFFLSAVFIVVYAVVLNLGKFISCVFIGPQKDFIGFHVVVFVKMLRSQHTLPNISTWWEYIGNASFGVMYHVFSKCFNSMQTKQPTLGSSLRDAPFLSSLGIYSHENRGHLPYLHCFVDKLSPV